MAESAIHIEGIDETTQKHVRIHLRVLTSEESSPAVVGFAAPRGFLPEAQEREVARRRAADTSNCQAQVFASARGVDAPGVQAEFSAPRGFLPAS